MITLTSPLIASSTSLWKLAGHPSKPIGLMTHSNCPSPETVNAVRCWDCLSNGIFQNPDVRSRAEKIEDPALQMSPMHSLTSFIEFNFELKLKLTRII
jgi:hypothetical protein